MHQARQIWKVDSRAGKKFKSDPTPLVTFPATPLIGQPTVMPPLSSLSCEQIPKETEPTVISDSHSSIKGRLNYGQEDPTAIRQRMAYIANVSGDSSGAMVTDDLDIAEELSAISTPEEDHHQILEQLKSL